MRQGKPTSGLASHFTPPLARLLICLQGTWGTPQLRTCPSTSNALTGAFRLLRESVRVVCTRMIAHQFCNRRGSFPHRLSCMHCHLFSMQASHLFARIACRRQPPSPQRPQSTWGQLATRGTVRADTGARSRLAPAPQPRACGAALPSTAWLARRRLPLWAAP